MADTPKQKPGLLSGLARVLHLHQLPQTPESPLTTPARNPALSPSSTTRSFVNEIPPISGFTVQPLRENTPIKQTSPSTNSGLMTKNATSESPVRKTLIQPAKKSNLQATASTKWSSTAHVTSTPTIPARKGLIITDYDRILELVRVNKTIKLDEIARILSMKEEQVAQELQTLEDNGLVDVKYPAFGEPLIYYKQPEA